jgi:hypothetical protein
MSDGFRTRLLFRGLAAPVLLLAVVPLAAGRLSYWQGWVYGP